MADPVTDSYSILLDLLEQVEEIGLIAQVGVSLGLTLVALLFTRFVLVRIAWKIVRRTEVEWDN